MSSDLPTTLRLVVKNTFLEVEFVGAHTASRRVHSCMARLSPPLQKTQSDTLCEKEDSASMSSDQSTRSTSASLMDHYEKNGYAEDVGEDVTEFHTWQVRKLEYMCVKTIAQEMPSNQSITPSAQNCPSSVDEAVLGAVPSEGSKVHGMMDDHGEPLCQPCAWFFKPFGCNKAAACLRCHACPEGEIKQRKKAKILRLRFEERPKRTR